MRRFSIILAGLALALSLAAESTRLWEQSGYDDFEKGTAKRLSLRSDGKILLAPRFTELGDPGLSYVWALAEDKQGNIYAGGGSPAKVIRVKAAGGKQQPGNPDVVFTAKELEVHALAIDRDDNLYVATSPDPRIYRVTKDGNSSVFFEPKAKYVWAMAFSPRGDLMIATGDKGEVYQVDRGGQGKVFYNSDEVHARSMTFDRQGNLILGTDPGGLVLRVTSEGKGFILYQAARKEVTAVEAGPDGSIYAAAVGDKPRAAMLPSPTIPQVVVVVPPPQPGTVPTPIPVPGGSEVYRIFPDGAPRRVWSSKEEVVYALSARSDGALLVGTGNKGALYQVHSPDLYTNLVRTQATQITALLNQRNGRMLLASSNSGKLMEMGSDYEAEGSFESEVLDTHNFAQWGRVSWRAENFQGTSVTLYTRSGNVDNPERNWTAWSPALQAPGQRTASPGARFLQWKAVLASSNGQKTPWLDNVEIAYLPKNVPPVIEDIEVTPPGYKFQPSITVGAGAAATISLPPLTRTRQQQPPPGPRFDAPSQMQQAQGYQGVRWAAHDDNDDSLTFNLYIRGKDETNWKLLKEKVTDKAYSWDSTAFPDGVYLIRVVASDSPSNTDGSALSDELLSDPFTIDNTPPQISDLKAVPEGGKLRVTLRAADVLSTIKKAEYSVDGSEWRLVLPTSQLSDSPLEDYSFTVDGGAGEHTVAVRVYDRVENVAVAKTVVR